MDYMTFTLLHFAIYINGSCHHSRELATYYKRIMNSGRTMTKIFKSIVSQKEKFIFWAKDLCSGSHLLIVI